MPMVSFLNMTHLLDNLPIGVVVHKTDTMIIYTNPEAMKLLRLNWDQMVGRQAIDPEWNLLGEDSLPLDVSDYPVNRVIATGTALTRELVGIANHHDKEPTWVMLSANQETIDNEKLIIVSFADVTEIVKSQQQIELASKVFDNSTDSIVITDHHNKIVSVNDAFEKLSGYRREYVLGKNPKLLSSGWGDDEFYRKMWHEIITTGKWEGEIWDRKQDGQLYAAFQTIIEVKNEHGDVTNYIGIAHDISEQKEKEKHIRQLAYFDFLTQLPNRKNFEQEVDSFIRSFHFNGKKFAIFFLDLDNFKWINDSLGHHIGDKILVHVSNLIQSIINEDSILARLGGDEFALLVPYVEVLTLSRLASRIIDSLKKPILIDKRELNVGLSIGISLFPENGDNYNDLLKNSDSAMYEAKNKGRNNFKFFSEKMNQLAQERLELDTRLHHAVQCHDFFLVYQPKFSYRHQECIGFEALIRWNDSALGFVSPDVFIPIAEQSGYIYEIGLWVLSKAFDDIKKINQEMGVRYTVAINISGKQLEDVRFLNDLRDLIQTTNIDTECIEFEITETSVMQSIDQILPILFKIKFLGIKLSIDDFGTGYSSMAYLKKMPIDTLKIDREFISNIDTDLDDMAIVKSTISLAKTFKLDLVAEGVETQEHAAILQEMDCDSYQGYYYSKPLEISLLIDFLRNQCNQAGNITQLIYASKAAQSVSFDDVSKILDVAHEQNPKHSLTGCLMHNGTFFLQIIEGPDSEVKQLMHNIDNDTRHYEIKLLGTKQIMRRDFNGWNMGYINNSHAIQNLLLKFTGKKVFDPYTLNYEETKSLILELSKVL